MRVDHVLLTRFNLPSAGPESLIRAREHWLQQRIVLFERYCLPSVVGQTRPVRWIVYLDPESPGWLVDRMEAHAGTDAFTAIYRESVSREQLLADLRTVVPEPGEVLVTTNLDNDDGLARDFSQRVCDAVGGGLGRQVVYVDQGLILCNDRTYLRHDDHNAFCSVAEPWTEPTTCWSAWHTVLDREMPAVHVTGAPGWLQVIHGDNVSNRVRGRLVSPAAYRTTLFPGLIDDVPDRSRRELVLDVAVSAPLRVARESARMVVKRLLLAAGGQRAVDRVLSVRARFRGTSYGWSKGTH